MTIVVRTTRKGSISSTATVTGEPADLDQANNTAVAVTTVAP